MALGRVAGRAEGRRALRGPTSRGTTRTATAADAQPSSSTSRRRVAWVEDAVGEGGPRHRRVVPFTPSATPISGDTVAPGFDCLARSRRRAVRDERRSRWSATRTRAWSASSTGARCGTSARRRRCAAGSGRSDARRLRGRRARPRRAGGGEPLLREGSPNAPRSRRATTSRATPCTPATR